jgi:hypothetical protein
MCMWCDNQILEKKSQPKEETVSRSLPVTGTPVSSSGPVTGNTSKVAMYPARSNTLESSNDVPDRDNCGQDSLPQCHATCVMLV